MLSNPPSGNPNLRKAMNLNQLIAQLEYIKANCKDPSKVDVIIAGSSYPITFIVDACYHITPLSKPEPREWVELHLS